MVNNAGISVESTRQDSLKTHETSAEDFEKTWRVNTKGVFLGCKYATEQMLKQDIKFGKEAGWSKIFSPKPWTLQADDTSSYQHCEHS